MTLSENKTICCQSFINCRLYWPGMGKAASACVSECFLVYYKVSAAAALLIDYVLSQCIMRISYRKHAIHRVQVTLSVRYLCAIQHMLDAISILYKYM